MWVPPGLRKPVGQPEDVGRRVGLLLDGFSGRPVLLPHGDDHERQQYGVDHAEGRVDEAGHVVVLPARVGGHQALDQLEAGECEQANSPDHQDAVEYGEWHSENSPPGSGSPVF